MWKRTPLLIAVGAVVVALAIGLVWRSWAGASRATPQGSPSVIASASPTRTADGGSTPSVLATQTVAALPDPPILAHRGGMEHHQLETMQAMEAAARQGFAIETDVRFTSDGVAVLVHDEAATKGLDCGGKDIRVWKTTWATLKKTCRSLPTSEDANSYPVPTLDAALEAIAAASPTAWVFLEIKTDETDARLKTLLATPAKYGLSDRVVWTSFDLDRLTRVRTLETEAKLMLFVSQVELDTSTIAAVGLWGVAVDVEKVLIAQSTDWRYLLLSLRLRGIKVAVWTANEQSQWADWDVRRAELVMTDYPEKYRDWLANR